MASSVPDDTDEVINLMQGFSFDPVPVSPSSVETVTPTPTTDTAEAEAGDRTEQDVQLAPVDRTVQLAAEAPVPVPEQVPQTKPLQRPAQWTRPLLQHQSRLPRAALPNPPVLKVPSSLAQSGSSLRAQLLAQQQDQVAAASASPSTRAHAHAAPIVPISADSTFDIAGVDRLDIDTLHWGSAWWDLIYQLAHAPGPKSKKDSVVKLVQRQGPFLPCQNCRNHYDVHVQTKGRDCNADNVHDWLLGVENSVRARQGRPAKDPKANAHRYRSVYPSMRRASVAYVDGNDQVFVYSGIMRMHIRPRDVNVRRIRAVREHSNNAPAGKAMINSDGLVAETKLPTAATQLWETSMWYVIYMTICSFEEVNVEVYKAVKSFLYLMADALPDPDYTAAFHKSLAESKGLTGMHRLSLLHWFMQVHSSIRAQMESTYALDLKLIQLPDLTASYKRVIPIFQDANDRFVTLGMRTFQEELHAALWSSPSLSSSSTNAERVKVLTRTDQRQIEQLIEPQEISIDTDDIITWLVTMAVIYVMIGVLYRLAK